MGNVVASTLTVKIDDLTAKLAVARAEYKSTQTSLRDLASEMSKTAAPSQAMKDNLASAAQAANAAQASVSKLSSAVEANRAALARQSGEGEHNAQIFREKLVLAHETLIGSYKRGAGSLIVLSERTGGLGGALATLVTPITATVGAVLLLVGSFAKAAGIAEQWQESYGEIKAALDATGASFGVTNAQIGTTIDALRQLHGVNTEIATEMVELFSRQRDIGVNSYVQLGQAAAGYARVTGTDVSKASQELVSALDGGYDAITKLDNRFSFLSTSQAQAIHDFDESGQKAQAFAVAIGALQAKFGPLVNDGLTPLQLGVNDLKDAWQGLTHAIGESSWLTSFNESLGHVLSGLGIMIDRLHGAKTAAEGFTAPSLSVPSAGTPASADGGAEQLRILREIQDENLKLKADDAERGRIKQELARDEEALKSATGGEATIIQDNIALLQRQQRELNNRVGSGQLQGLRDELEQEVAQHRLAGEQEKQYDLAYWQSHLDQVQAGSKAEIEIRKEISSLQHDLSSKALSDEWQNFSENMRLKIDASKSNVAQQIALANQWVQEGQALYGNDIKNYKAALDEKTRLVQQQSQDERKIREIALASTAEIEKIDLAGAPAPKGKSSIVDSLFGDVDGSGAKADLDRRMDALKAEYAAKQAEFNDVISGSDSTPVQIAEAQAKLAAANEQYAVDTLNLNKQASQQVTQAWTSAFEPIEHAFDSSIEGMLRGTQTLQDGMRKLAQNIVMSFIQSGIKQAFSGLASQIASLTGGAMGAGGPMGGIGSALGMGKGAIGAGSQTAQTTALTANTTALTSLTASLTGNTAVTTMNSATTTAGTAATTSNTASQTTNLVGNTLQTDANTAAVGANTAALSTASATGGGGGGGGLGSILGMVGMLAMFDKGTDSVSHDMVAQIHKGEIIVPAAQSADIRSGKSMLGYGGHQSMMLPNDAAENMRHANSNDAPGGSTINNKSSGDTNFHYAPTINAKSNVDLNSVLTQQGSTMRRWLSNQARNGAFKNN
jgi:hypothetical protein